MRKFFAFILLAILAAFPAVASAVGYQPLRVEPSRFMFEGKPGEEFTGSINVTNKGVAAVTPRSTLSDWTLDLNKQIETSAASSLADSTLNGWLKFNPRQFTVQPKESQTVRFTIRVPRDAAPGERRGMITFEQAVPYDASQPAGASVRVVVTATIYVAVLPVQRTVEMAPAISVQSNKQDDRTRVMIELKGTGNGHFRGFGEFAILKDGEDTPLAKGQFDQLIALPGVSTRYVGEWKGTLEPGKYKILINIKSEDPKVEPILRSYSYSQA